MGKDGILKRNNIYHEEAVIALEHLLLIRWGGGGGGGIGRNKHKRIGTTLKHCEILLLCSNQGITFCWHRENEASENKQNFNEILQLVANHDKVARSRFNSLPKMRCTLPHKFKMIY